MAETFIIGEDFIGVICLSNFGDNVFYGHRLTEILKKQLNWIMDNGAIIFGYYTNNPEAFGCLPEFDDEGVM